MSRMGEGDRRTSSSAAVPLLPAGRFFGTSKCARSAGPFRLTESAYSSGTRLPRHAHEQGHFVLVLSGHYEEIVAGRDVFERRPMSLLYLPGDLVHEERHVAPGRHFMVEPPAPFMRRIGEMGVDLTRPYDLTDTHALAVARQLYRELCHPDSVSTLAIESLTLQLFVEIRRERMPVEKRVPRFVRHAQEILRARFAESLSVESLSREVGVDPVHLTKAFRRWNGQGISDYVRGQRLDYACREMMRADRSLFDIAIAAGYYDQSHFCRAFRQQTGMTPSDFRRQARRRVERRLPRG
jgi:AraC family transcriptional regulator